MTRLSILLIAWFLTACSSGGEKVATDSDLIERFNKHRSSFLRVLDMAAEDKNAAIISSSPEHTRSFDTGGPTRELSGERWLKYQKLFREIGCEDGILRQPQRPNVLYFSCSSVGSIGWGIYKGIAYSDAPLSPVFENLDHIEDGLGEGEMAYREIGDDWYLYYQWFD